MVVDLDAFRPHITIKTPVAIRVVPIQLLNHVISKQVPLKELPDDLVIEIIRQWVGNTR